ncbi:MAG: FIST C-terminal domain-containing protein [Labilithrix sp.]|nr:FIST C-terminal domain-containing protein [Labilithrix sp.]MBX3222537.1 FIST C-terminal domain-containing protein [Labilithrix sp.]
MLIFGSGMSVESSAEGAAREAATEARAPFGDTKPKLAIVFGSVSYPDIASAPRAVREIVGDVPIVGGSAGACVLGPRGIASRGVSVVLLGGDDIEVATREVELGGPELVEVVPAAQQIARGADEAAARGLEHCVCLVFAPGIHVDGEALVAAIRKGAGPRAQLAGALTGDDMTMDRPGVFAADELRADRVLLAGLYTRKQVGISARHGWRVVGPLRTVTRAEGDVLYELDGRPAAEVWVEDARRAGGTPPKAREELTPYLANRYELGLADSGTHDRAGGELVARALCDIGADGSVRLSASIGEGRRVQLMHAGRKDLLRASTNAAAEAVLRAGGHVAGALVLSCTGRLAALGEEFSEEAALIRDRVAAPIGGACVFGEVAKSARDVDAFFNTTAAIVAFGA